MNVVAHNILSMYGSRQLNINKKKTEKSQEKLASGYRINRSADDAAGLSISEKMRRQIRDLNRGALNSQDGISMLQIADGALSETIDMMHRITELSIQSANGTNSESDRKAIQQEVVKLLTEMDKVSSETKFNDFPIFPQNTRDVINEIKHSTPDWENPVSSLEASNPKTAVDPDVTNYLFSADAENGLTINGTNHPWDEILDDAGKSIVDLENGRYSVEENGIDFSFDVYDAASLDDIAKGLDGSVGVLHKGESYEVIETYTEYKKSVTGASTGIKDLGSFYSAGGTTGTYTISADDDGISLGIGSKINWGDTLSSGKTLHDSILQGGSIELSSAGISLSVEINQNATIDGFKAALNGTSYSISSSGTSSVGYVSSFYDNKGNNPDFSANEYSWTFLDDPANDDALTALGYDPDNLHTGDSGRMYVVVNHNISSIGQITADFSMNGRTIEYRLSQDSVDEVQALVAENRTITAGEVLPDLKFTYGNSSFTMNAIAKRDFNSSGIYSYASSFTLNIRGLYGGLNTSNPSIKGMEEGNKDAGTEVTRKITKHTEDHIETDIAASDYNGIEWTSRVTAKEPETNHWWIQTGTNAQDGFDITIGSIGTKALGIDKLDVQTEEGANDSIDRIKGALIEVTGIRSKIGAQQNRLEHTVKINNNSSENLDASESKIRDTDVSDEVVNYLKNNMLEQVSESMIAQANQSNQGVMSLLEG